jgi:predicted DNA-binding protein (UPF0251 family)
MTELSNKNYLDEVDYVETLNGSTYTYLQDGRTQRFKKTANKMCEPQDVLVYLPSFEALQKKVPKLLEEMAAEVMGMYEQTLLEYIQGNNKKCHVIDKNGNEIRTNEQASKTEGQIFIALGDETKVEFYVPVSRIPRVGFYTYDTRRFQENDQWLKERHMGHEVVKIVLKNGQTIESSNL